VAPRVSPVAVAMAVAMAVVDAETAAPTISSRSLVLVHFYRSPHTLCVSGSVGVCV
jgi:hypothetical protein